MRRFRVYQTSKSEVMKVIEIAASIRKYENNSVNKTLVFLPVCMSIVCNATGRPVMCIAIESSPPECILQPGVAFVWSNKTCIYLRPSCLYNYPIKAIRIFIQTQVCLLLLLLKCRMPEIARSASILLPFVKTLSLPR